MTLTLVALATHETIIKKSRFTVLAAPAVDPDAAMQFVQANRNTAANHNCWAYRIGEQYRFSDDGEPGGTAGRPILAAIDGQQLDYVVVVVTRFFGGIKLGTGGLVRAYGGSAAECLRIAARIEHKDRVAVEICIPYDAIGAIYPLIDRFMASKLGEECSDNGVVMRVDLAADDVETMKQCVMDATRGVGRLLVIK